MGDTSRDKGISGKVERLRQAREFLEGLFQRMGAQVDVTLKYLPEGPTFDITGKDAGMIIGRHGRTLLSLQYLVNLIINQGVSKRDEVRVILDSQGYRSRKENQLRDLATKMAARVKRTGKPVTLNPMLPFERKVIHTTLSEDEEITTFSVGRNPYKRVVIAPAGFTQEDYERMIRENDQNSELASENLSND